jgi:exodeoxyribonuclease-5
MGVAMTSKDKRQMGLFDNVLHFPTERVGKRPQDMGFVGPRGPRQAIAGLLGSPFSLPGGATGPRGPGASYSISLSEDQAQVFRAVLDWLEFRANPIPGVERSKLLTMGGLAGTGKTTVIGALATRFRDNRLLVAYATFTGRASSVLSGKLAAAGVQTLSRQAKPDGYRGKDQKHLFLDPTEMRTPFCGTLHKLLYRPVLNEKEEILGWKKREVLDRPYDLIVVDEASMVADDMLLDLQMHQIPILAVGDHGQLPPVMASGNLMATPELRLKKIHRQARDNPIIKFAWHVRKTGELEDKFEDGKHIRFRDKKDLEKVLREAYSGVQSAIDVGILCYTNKWRIRLNLAARRVLGHKGYPNKGEILICLKNMQDSEIYNGMRGVVATDTFISTPGDWKFGCDVGFPDEGLAPRHLQLCGPQFNRERVFEGLDALDPRMKGVKTMADIGALFDFGYAMTVHKSQGSQMKHVIFFVESLAFEDAELWKKLAYTAVTRSSDRLTILV